MTEDCADIRRLYRSELVSIEAIVRRTGLARNTVRAALAADQPRAWDSNSTLNIKTELRPRG